MAHHVEFRMERDRLERDLRDTSYKERCQVELFMNAVRAGYITDGCLIRYTEIDKGALGPVLRLDIKPPEIAQTLDPDVLRTDVRRSA
jgi:hypothetical protein